MDKTIRVLISEADIRAAIRKTIDGWNGNPLTLAIRRAFDCKYLDPFVTTWARKPMLYVSRNLCYTAGREREFIENWEAGKAVKPLSFRLQRDPWWWAQERRQLIKYHERLCWKCSTFVPGNACLCGRFPFDRECSICQAVFCNTCLPSIKPFSSCRGNPDRHLALRAEPFAPTFSHRCREQGKAVTL